MTGVDLSDADPNNDETTELYAITSAGTKPVVDVPARGRRELKIVFHELGRPNDAFGNGDKAVLQVPLPNAPHASMTFQAD